MEKEIEKRRCGQKGRKVMKDGKGWKENIKE